MSLGALLLAGSASPGVAAASAGTPGYTVTTIALADGAGGVAVDPATGLAYVGTLDTVNVIDEATAAIVQSIDTGSGPAYDVAVDASTDTIYTATYGGVDVIDGTTGTVTARIDLSEQVVSVVLDTGSGVLYAAYDNGDDIAAIDIASDAVVATTSLAAGLSAYFLAVDPATSTLYAAGTVSQGAGALPTGAVWVLDGTTLDTTQTIPFSNGPNGNSFPVVDVNATTGQAYVSDASGVYVINPSTYAVTQLSAAPSCSIAVDSAAGTLIVGENSSVDVLSAATGKVLMSAAAPANGLNGHGIAFDPDTGVIYATSLEGSGLVMQLTPGISPAFSTGTSAVFTTGSAGSFTIAASGTPTATLTVAGKLPAGVTFTPGADGEAVLAGTPAARSGGLYRLTITASNGVAPSATQAFTLTVRQPPAIVSPRTARFRYGQRTKFVIATTGYPFPSLRETGHLPRGFTFRSGRTGTAVLTGDPVRADIGKRFTITITVSNGIGRAVTEKLTIEVLPARHR